MRLIKPTTLLLLMAIACGTGSPQDGRSGGSGAAPLTEEQKCTLRHCQAKFNTCFADPNCKATFLCATAAKGDITKTLNCGVDARARAIVQCSADNACFNKKDQCPTLLGLHNIPPNQPDLVKLMTPSFWYGVASNDKDPRNYFNFGCNKLAVVGSQKDVGVVMSICGRNKTSEGCVTPYFNFFGQGNQIGDTGVIKVLLKKGPFVIGPATLYIHVRAATNLFAIVESCLDDPKNVQMSNTYAIFSRYKTYEGALAASGQGPYEERVLKHVLSSIGQDFSKFHKINGSQCEN